VSLLPRAAWYAGGSSDVPPRIQHLQGECHSTEPGVCTRSERTRLFEQLQQAFFQWRGVRSVLAQIGRNRADGHLVVPSVLRASRPWEWLLAVVVPRAKIAAATAVVIPAAGSAYSRAAAPRSERTQLVEVLPANFGRFQDHVESLCAGRSRIAVGGRGTNLR
jgi:hypothetical protein